jgi:hypothetical protein
MAESTPTPRTSRSAARRQQRRRRNRIAGLVVALVVVAAAAGGAWWWGTKRTSSVSAGAPTTSPAPPGSTSSTSTTATTQPPGPGFVAGKVTGVGDSVMMDYQGLLEKLIPGIAIDGNVGRQWTAGEQLLAQQKAAGTLGAVVVVGLSTNGPITASMFDSMMTTLSGASRVVFVNVHVGQPWQDPNNAVIASGVARYPNAVLADWNAVASEHPEWFGSDGTHIPFSGPAPEALSKLVADKITNG